jgi:tetratricopeptide (TPR) repeat protein
LADHIAVFVRSGGSAGMKVTSHAENLAQSACKQSAGDRLWCGSCHDPHAPPEPQARAAWFRSKCQSCHAANACRAPAAARRARANDCTACHMPRNPVSDAEHVVYTDHSIPRRPGVRATPPRADAPLVLFSGGEPAPRDLALAYAILAQQEPRNTAYRTRAFELLRSIANPDAEVMVALAEYQRESDPPQAVSLYERAIAADPSQLTARVNLGAIRMERGEYAEAIRIWQDALSRNPGLVLVRANLALALMRTQSPAAARAVLEKAAEFNPLFGLPGQLLDQVRQATGR